MNCCEVCLLCQFLLLKKDFRQYTDEVQSCLIVSSEMNCLSVKSVCGTPLSEN